MFDKTYTLITMKKSWQNIYDEEVLTKHLHSLRWRSLDKTYTFMFDKTFTMKSWQNMYDEVMTKHVRRSHENSYTMKSWQNIYVHVWQIIYVHVWQNIYDEVMTKHKRWSHDKTCTFITMKKSWESIYDEVSTNHLRSCLTKHIRWSLFPVVLSKCHVVTLFQRS